MSYTILEENSRTVLVRMPRSYLSRLDAPKKSHTRSRLTWDDEMTPENLTHYLEAKRDLENGVNIVSWEEIQKKYA